MNYAIRNNKILELRKIGQSLEKIGGKYDISKQRVCQILERFMSVEAMPLKDVLDATDIGYARFYIILKKLSISRRTKWNQEVINKILSYLSEIKCKWCKGTMPTNRVNSKFCSESCYLESWKYKNLPEDRKKAHNVHVKRWQKKHPKEWAQIQAKAGKKWRLKKKGLDKQQKNFYNK